MARTISEILIAICCLLYFLQISMKEKRNILKVGVLVKAIEAVAYGIVGEFNAVILALLKAVRSFCPIWMKREEWKKKIFVLLMIVAVILFGLTYSGVKTILGIIAIFVGSYAQFFLSEQRIRKINMTMSLVIYIPFLALSGTKVGVVLEFLTFTMNLFTHIKYKSYYEERDNLEFKTNQ